MTRLLASFLPQLSADLCDILPECDEETISAEVGRRLRTTLQGAHLWMLSPFLIRGHPLQALAEEIVIDELEESQGLGTLARTLKAPFISTKRIDRAIKRLSRLTPQAQRALRRAHAIAERGISKRTKRIIAALDELKTRR